MDSSFQLPQNSLYYPLVLQVLSNTRKILKCIPRLCQKRQYSSFYWNTKGVFLFQGREYYFLILSRLWGMFQIQKILQSMTVINAWHWELMVYLKHRLNTGQKNKNKRKQNFYLSGASLSTELMMTHPIFKFLKSKKDKNVFWYFYYFLVNSVTWDLDWTFKPLTEKFMSKIFKGSLLNSYSAIQQSFPGKKKRSFSCHTQ